MVKNLPANSRDEASLPGLGRSPGEGNGHPLQYFCLGNSMDRRAWQATVHGVAESDTTEQLHKHMIFPGVMCGCKSCNIKNAECQRIDVFKLWCWRRCMKIPWTAKNSNQSILKEINPDYSLEGLMLKLKLHFFG